MRLFAKQTGWVALSLSYVLAHADTIAVRSPVPRYAVLFHGKVGTMSSPSSTVAYGDANVLKTSFRSMKRHLFDTIGACDVFIHSWNPELRTTFGLLYPKAWQQHENVQHREKARSQALSLLRVLRAKQSMEATRKARFDHVLVFRHDVDLMTDLHKDVWAHPLVFAQHCCGGSACTVSRFIGDAHRSDFIENNMYLMDWYFAGESSVIDTFENVYTHFDLYTAGLSAHRITTRWMHFYLAYHVHFVLNMTSSLHFSMMGGFDYKLARHSQHYYRTTEPSFTRRTRVDPASSSYRMCPTQGYKNGLCPHIPEKMHKLVKTGFVGKHFIPRLNAWYYEIPKSGSSTMVKFFNLRHGGHSGYANNGPRRFAVIRHPVCRAISGLQTSYTRAAWRTNMSNSPCPFSKFPYLTNESFDMVMRKALAVVKAHGSSLAGSECGYHYHHFLSQSYFLQRARNFVTIRLEHVDRELADFCREDVSLNCDFGKMTRENSAPSHPFHALSETTRRMLLDHFRNEIQCLGYDTDSIPC